MEINQEFKEAVEDIAQTRVLTIGGKEYTSRPVHEVVPVEYAFPHITLYSLDSLVEYIESNKDEVALAQCQIVVTESTAMLFGPPTGLQRRRDFIVHVNANSKFKQSESYGQLETFRIWLMTQFQASPGQAALLKFISTIRAESAVTTMDDGVSQSVEAKTGIARIGDVEVPSPVTLQPFRTFAEVEQPESWFIFRLRRVTEKHPVEAALFEVQTNWQRMAAITAKAYLDDKLVKENVTVLA